MFVLIYVTVNITFLWHKKQEKCTTKEMNKKKMCKRGKREYNKFVEKDRKYFNSLTGLFILIYLKYKRNIFSTQRTRKM